MNQLKDAIEKAKENENKLILIVGLPGSMVNQNYP